MKIQNQGVRITEIPGLSSITVEQDEHSAHGVHVLVDDGRGERPRSFGVNELGELIEALQAAHTEARRMAGLPTTPADLGGPWASMGQIPASVERVIDRDDDPWNRTQGGQWPSDMRDSYAPFCKA